MNVPHQKEDTDWVNSPEHRERLHRRILRVVIIAQSLGGIGLAAGITVGAILAQELFGSAQFSGIPAALFTLGSAFAAFGVGRFSQRFGRRIGLTIGFLAGAIGAAGVIISASFGSLVWLLISLFIYGAGSATNLQARYAGTDLAPADKRAVAISMAMVATTFGAVLGPNLTEWTGNIASSVGIPKLTGPFLLAGIAFLLAGCFVFIYLRPDPLKIAAIWASQDQPPSEQPIAEKAQDDSIFSNRGVWLGTLVMILTQVVMISIMTMTPLHMQLHGHGLDAVGMVISIHVAAMFLPSLVTGKWVDRYGRSKMSVVATGLLFLSGMLAAWVPEDSLIGLILALALLGLGWNIGFIAGTAMLVDATSPTNRAKVQGTIDVWIALCGAAGGAFSGVLFAQMGYATFALIGGSLSWLIVPLIWRMRKSN